MSNIVDFKKPKPTPPANKPPKQPFINLPPMTKWLLISLLAIYGITNFLIGAEMRTYIYLNFGFVPALWTGQTDYPFDLNTLISPLTYIFLHANFMHIIMNCAMLMAFGAGVEKWMGGRKFIEFFILCGIASVIFETAIHPFSTNPVIGASGAESGLFAAILIVMQQSGRMPTGKYGIWPFAAIWVGISLLFALFGGALAGGQIAWAAHLGGFLSGFLFLKLKYFRGY